MWGCRGSVHTPTGIECHSRLANFYELSRACERKQARRRYEREPFFLVYPSKNGLTIRRALRSSASLFTLASSWKLANCNTWRGHVWPSHDDSRVFLFLWILVEIREASRTCNGWCWGGGWLWWGEKFGAKYIGEKIDAKKNWWEFGCRKNLEVEKITGYRRLYDATLYYLTFLTGYRRLYDVTFFYRL